jgi:hypothetical protein
MKFTTIASEPTFHKHHGIVIELLAGGPGGMRERVEEAIARHSMTAEQLGTACEEVLLALGENDVEGAAIGVAALNLTYPDHDADEYLEARSRIMNLRCPLLRMESQFRLPDAWQLQAEEMIDIIHDGAERIQAGFALGA